MIFWQTDHAESFEGFILNTSWLTLISLSQFIYVFSHPQQYTNLTEAKHVYMQQNESLRFLPPFEEFGKKLGKRLGTF